MQKQVQGVFQVSDGIMVQFSDGASGYFPTSFLLEQLNAGSNQVFVDSDPSPLAESFTAIPACAAKNHEDWSHIPN